MGKLQSIDAFVCNEPEVEVDAETSRILKQRMRTADEGRLVSAGGTEGLNLSSRFVAA